MKKLMIGLLASAVLFATPALAGKVFDQDSGVWQVRGYTGDGETYCILSTYWNDSSQININIFPSFDNDGEYQQYTTMTVYSPGYDTTGIPLETPFDGEVIIYNDGQPTTFEGEFAIKGPNRVIVRELGEEFSEQFVHGETMIVFPGTAAEMAVSLKGTQRAMPLLSRCLNRVLQ